MTGRAAMLQEEVGSMERELSRISRSFDLLLLITPTNADTAFEDFVGNGAGRPPVLSYRPIPVDPELLMRRLYNLRIEQIDDPPLAILLREQREHIANQLSVLSHRNSDKCLYASLHVYGGVNDKLYRLAQAIPEVLAPENHTKVQERLDAVRLAERARNEIAHYQSRDPRFLASVELRRDVSSATVTNGSLLLPESVYVTEGRAAALIAHEVGTHLLTYFNGSTQPLALMSTGLAGYEEMQEGLAVLAEYLAGGFTQARLRLLATRVIAVRMLLNQADFVEIYRELHYRLHLSQRAAFLVALRVWRGGGFTKDAIYLRGLLAVLAYLSSGGELELLFLGKFSARHIELVQDLLARGILRPGPFRPRVLDGTRARERLSALKRRSTVFDLIQEDGS